GMGEQGMSGRLANDGHANAQSLLSQPDTRVEYRRVDLGTATDTGERNNMLRYYERQEFETQKRNGYQMLNHRESETYIQSNRKVSRAQGLIEQHGASAGERQIACR